VGRDVIDLHTHLLAGLDDGPAEIEESVSIASFLAGLGFDHIFLTPHFRQGFFESPASRVKEVSFQLQAVVATRLSGVRFTEAHEVHLSSVFDSRGSVQEFLTFGASQRYVLLELPRQPFPFELLSRTIDRLFVEGIHVVLAHPEKHPELSREPSRYRELGERGVMLQLNLTSLAGFEGRRVRKVAEALCREGMVHAVGSDAHSLAQAVAFVPRGMQVAARVLGQKRLRAIMECADLRLGN
jgi:protein-tyrosine phosphatase